jgi:hypothetical protein
MMPDFTHLAYLREYGRQPRGRSTWGFQPARSWRALDGDMIDEPPFFAYGTLNEAKRQASAHYQERHLAGDMCIAVMP